MPAPTLVASYETSSYTTGSSPKTLSITTQAGDRVVVCAMSLDVFNPVATPSGNSMSFSSIYDNSSTGTGGSVRAWMGLDASGGTNWTLSSTCSSSSWGMTVLVLRNCTGFNHVTYTEGTSTSADGTTSVSLAANNNAVLAMIQDAAGVNTAGVSWMTVNGYTPTTGNGGVITRQGSTGVVGYHVGYYPDNGALSSANFGITAGSAFSYDFLAFELNGAAATSTLIGWITA